MEGRPGHHWPEALAIFAKSGRALVARRSRAEPTGSTSLPRTCGGAQSAIEYSMGKSKPFPTGANWNILEGLFNQYLPLAFSGAETPANTLATIQDLVEQAM